MPFAELDRVAIVVEDLEMVAESLKAVLAIELTLRDAPELGLRAGIGNSGIELVQKTAAEVRPERYWRGPLAALCIRVEDADEAARRMEAAGYELVQTATTAGGMKEYFYGANFHDIPIVLHESSGDLLHDVGGGNDSGPLDVDWKD